MNPASGGFKIIPFDPGPVDCSHRAWELRRRTKPNGWSGLVKQCLSCGGLAVPNTIGKAEAVALGVNPEAAPAFDEAAFDNRKHLEAANASMRAQVAHEEFKLKQKAERAEALRQWHAENDWYYETDEWREKRALVFKRANFVCEGCGKAKATQAHHVTYDHFGNEFLFELLAVCEPCHTRIHGKDDEFLEEPSA